MPFENFSAVGISSEAFFILAETSFFTPKRAFYRNFGLLYQTALLPWQSVLRAMVTLFF
jgi:hypothetical protein